MHDTSLRVQDLLLASLYTCCNLNKLFQSAEEKGQCTIGKGPRNTPNQFFVRDSEDHRAATDIVRVPSSL